MKKYSVWYMPYNKKYLITHPWIWFKYAWRCLRDAWRRSVYGWTYGDVWDWNTWFIRTVPSMFRYMADHGCAYPGRPPFETPERWHEWLYEMADLIETADETWQDEHNEYYEEYINHLMDNWKPWKEDENGMYHLVSNEPSELQKKYTVRAEELAKQGEDNIRHVFALVGKYFNLIWD